MIKNFLALVVVLSFCIGVGGCGDEEELVCSGLKKSFVACGGEIEGSWEYVTTCIGSSIPFPFEGSCDAADIRGVLTRLGNLEVDAGNIKVELLSETMSIDAVYPDACLSEVVNCEKIQQLYEEIPVTNVTCKEQSQSCVCDADIVKENISDQYVYTKDGNKLVVELQDMEIEYCVKGDTLTIKQTEKAGTENEVIMHAVLEKSP